jgi:hypothetical protein
VRNINSDTDDEEKEEEDNTVETESTNVSVKNRTGECYIEEVEDDDICMT